MNIRSILTILLTLICLESFSQSIFSILRLDDAIEIKSDLKVTEMTISTTFFDKRQAKIKKDSVVLNDKNKIVSELQFQENEVLETRFSRTLDASGTKILTTKNERWHAVLGYTSETAIYEYDQNGYIIKITIQDQNNQIIRTTIVKNNVNGHPIELKPNIGNPNPYITETAEYDYPNNMATTKFLDDKGNVIGESQIKIDLSIKDLRNSKYDTYGNLLLSGKYSYEYKYDNQQNWTTKTIYKSEGRKLQKYQVLTRKIKYE